MSEMKGSIKADGQWDGTWLPFGPASKAIPIPRTEVSFFQEYGKLKIFRKGAVILRQDADPKGVFLLVEGKVKVCRHLSSDQRQIFYFHGPGDLLGGRQVIAGGPCTFQEECLENCQTIFVPAEAFVTHTERSFAQYLLAQQSREFSAWADHCAMAARRSVRQRLAICLLHLDQIYRIRLNQTSVICLSRSDLADYAATSLESTVRALREMKDSGLVHIHGRRMMLLNRPALGQIAEYSELKRIEA